jgi:hypothetical protein
VGYPERQVASTDRRFGESPLEMNTRQWKKLKTKRLQIGASFILFHPRRIVSRNELPAHEPN